MLCKHLSQRSRRSWDEGLGGLHGWCIVDLGGWGCYKHGNLSHILFCRSSRCMGLLLWHKLWIRGCSSGLGHHSCIVRSLVWVGNTRGIAWLWWHRRWCQMVLWLMGDRTSDAICSMGCPWCILVGGTYIGSVWNDGVEVSRLCVNEVKTVGSSRWPLPLFGDVRRRCLWLWVVVMFLRTSQGMSCHRA